MHRSTVASDWFCHTTFCHNCQRETFLALSFFYATIQFSMLMKMCVYACGCVHSCFLCKSTLSLFINSNSMCPFLAEKYFKDMTFSLRICNFTSVVTRPFFAHFCFLLQGTSWVRRVRGGIGGGVFLDGIYHLPTPLRDQYLHGKKYKQWCIWKEEQ